MNFTRRGILQTGVAIGAGALAGTLTRFGKLSALTAPANDYRALVCIFLFGGNDSNNLIVPMDGNGYAAYSQIRKNLALAQNTLLEITTAGGAGFGLHPKLVETQALFKSKNLALVANVGTLVRPLTRDQYVNSPALAPINLFSHADQQAEWQSSIAQGQSTTGWGGRLADQVGYMNGGSTFPTMMSVSGNALFTVGQQSRATAVIPGSPLGLQGFDNSAASQARMNAVTQLLGLNSGASLVQQANLTTQQGIKNAALLSQAMNGAPALQTQFPKSTLGDQLLEVAKVIQVRQQLGNVRQIFFCSLGGFDTHTNQLNEQDTLFTELDESLGAFYRALQELNVEGSVTAFTESDFSRTLQPNTNGGTDHAWGSHHIVMGGMVKGGDLFGTFPTLALGGPNDAGAEGRWIPSIATDQYGATLSKWFGLPSNLNRAVFPNIANFPSADLGFMS